MLEHLTIEDRQDGLHSDVVRTLILEYGKPIATVEETLDGWEGATLDDAMAVWLPSRLDAIIAIFDHLRKVRFGIDYTRKPWPVFPPDEEAS